MTIHVSEKVSGGVRIVTDSGEIWFHPDNGGKPEKIGQTDRHRDTLEKCQSRGADHKAYGWSQRPERDWSTEQRAAYLKGYGIK